MAALVSDSMKIISLHPFSRDSDIEEEAAVWLIKLDSDGPFSNAQLTEIREWLQRSPAHREALERASVLWERMDVLSRLAVPLAEMETPRTGVQRGRDIFSKSASRAIGAAAVVVVAIFAWLLSQTGPEVPLIANGKYTTRVGEVVSLTLVDGSVAQLNTNTQLEVRYRNDQRMIRLLRGEAHFDVSHNPRVPFLVYAGSGAIRAVGTAFGVRLMDDDVAVTVTAGRVDLESLDTGLADGSALSPEEAGKRSHGAVRVGSLTAGQKTLMSNHRKQVDVVQTLTTRQLAMQLSWREGLLMFAGEPLEKVVAEINRYTDLAVVIVDPQIKAVRIGGQFKIGESDALLEVLQASFGIAVKRVGDGRVELSSAR